MRKQSEIQRQVENVLDLADCDTQERFACATTAEERQAARDNEQDIKAARALITNAPELLAALTIIGNRLTSACGNDKRLLRIRTVARAALAKVPR
ncbi:MAG: hypothetical protein Q7R68_10810 [Nitrospirales bacterium]|nr:hypothetical protein [Nitrospirales bacterium]